MLTSKLLLLVIVMHDPLTKGHWHQSPNKEEVINTKEIDCLSRHAEISFQFKIKTLEYVGSFCQYTI